MRFVDKGRPPTTRFGIRAAQRSSRRSLVSLALVATLWAAGSVAGSAQEAAGVVDDRSSSTRVDLLEAAREAKAAATVEPSRTAVERGLQRIRSSFDVVGNNQSGWNGLRLAGGAFPAGAGFAYGIGFTDPDIASRSPDADHPNRVGIDMAIARSTAGYEHVSAELAVRDIGGSPLGAAARARYYEYPEEDFFGLGPSSREADRSNYFFGSREVEVDAWWRFPVRGLRGGATVGYLSPHIGQGLDRRFPSTDRHFDAPTIPGLLAQPDFGHLDGWVRYDTRDDGAFPRAGGSYGLRYSTFLARGAGAFDFRRLDVEAQYHLPLAGDYRTLAVRAKAVLTDAKEGHEVPFYYQPTLGGKETLRGFREFRFRDRNALLLTAEYRWQAWRVLTPAFFIDAGKVARRRADLDLNDLEVSYGIGFRFHTPTRLVARLDLAKSREGFIPFLRFDHVF